MIVYLPEPPSANRWWRKFRNRMVLSPEARAYKTEAAQIVEAVMTKYGGECIYPPHRVIVDIVWTRKRKAGDLDKRLGVVLDAMQGLLYANDNQIIGIRASRRDAIKGIAEPGLRIETHIA